jgi:hypothetical protein
MTSGSVRKMSGATLAPNLDESYPYPRVANAYLSRRLDLVERPRQCKRGQHVGDNRQEKCGIRAVQHEVPQLFFAGPAQAYRA